MCSGCGCLGGEVRLPVPGQQFGDLARGVIGDTGKHVGEPAADVDMVELAGLDQGEHSGRSMPAAIAATEGPVLAPHGETAHGTLSRVVAHAEAAVIEEPREGAPSLQRVVDRLGSIALRRELLALFAQPGLKRVRQRLRAFLP